MKLHSTFEVFLLKEVLTDYQVLVNMDYYFSNKTDAKNWIKRNAIKNEEYIILEVFMSE